QLDSNRHWLNWNLRRCDLDRRRRNLDGALLDADRHRPDLDRPPLAPGLRPLAPGLRLLAPGLRVLVRGLRRERRSRLLLPFVVEGGVGPAIAASAHPAHAGVEPALEQQRCGGSIDPTLL